MARDIVNRQVNIYIQSGEAQKAYDQLIKKQNEWKAALEKTTDPKEIKKLKDDLAALEEPISRAAKKLKGELEPSLKDTEATANNLRNQLKRMSESDKDFAKVTAQYQQANKELEQQRGKIGLISKAWKSFWQEAKTVAAGVIIGNTIQSALQTVLGYVSGIVTGSAKISDELADIQRITGLSAQEVKALNSELKKIDTRTSVGQLREIVIIAGKLGIEKDNVLGFTQAIDKLNIALGGELGDITKFSTDLGKILNVFEGEVNGENITRVGNAIVDLANKGVASGPFIVEFAQRVSGIAKTSNLSLDAVIGLAAGLEETGNRVESSSTAIQKLITTIGQDVPAAAKIANVPVKEFTQLFAAKPQEALIKYAEGLQKNKSSFAEISKAFKDAGEDGARTIAVLSTLGQKGDFMREKIQAAGAAMNDTSKIQAAFDLKNKTAGAELDKFKKNINSLFTSSSFQAAGEAAIKIMNGFVNVVRASFSFIKEHGGLIATLGIIYAALTVRIKGANIAQAAWNAITALGNTIQRAYATSVVLVSIATQVITGRMRAAAGAQLAWQTIMAAGKGPLAIMLVTIGALVVAVGNLFSGTRRLTAEQRLQNELDKRTNEMMAERKAQVELLSKLAANENANMVQRKKAIADLIAINPEFAKTLKINAQGHLEGAEAIAKYIEQLKIQTEAEATRSLLLDKTKKKNDLLLELGLSEDDVKKAGADPKSFLKNKSFSYLFSDAGKVLGTSNLLKEIDILQNKIAASAVTAKTALDETSTAATSAASTASGAADKEKDKLKQLLQELEKIREELRLSRLSGMDREMAELDIKFKALVARAGNNHKLLLIIDELFQQSRMRIIETYTQREVELWKKNGEQVALQQDENIKAALKRISNTLESMLSNDKRSEIQKITKQIEQETADATAEKWENLINRLKLIIEFASQVSETMRIINDAKTAKENEELERDKAINDEKKRNLDARLKAGTISQAAYNRELDRMDKERERKEKAARIKQFERDKQAAFVNALVNNAGAITTTLEKFGPPIPPNFLGMVAMGLTVGTGIAQLVTIANQKAPAFARGGKMFGCYHSEGGNAIIDGYGNKIGEIEKDENIMNRRASLSRNRYTVSGTPSQIVSTLNSKYGGVSWDSSATLRPAWADKKQLPFNLPVIKRYYAAGGKFDQPNTGSGAGNDTSAVMLQLMDVLIKLDSRMAKPIKAYTLLSEQQDALARLQDIQSDGTMK